MAKLNDYNQNKMGTSNGTMFFERPYILKDKIGDNFPSSQEEQIAIADNIDTLNYADLFSYQHNVLLPEGIIYHVDGSYYEYSLSEGMYAPSPVKQSLGGIYGYVNKKNPAILRGFTGPSAAGTEGGEIPQSVLPAQSGQIYSIRKDPVPLAPRYQIQGLTDIQFTNDYSLSSLSQYNDDIFNNYYRQYMLLYGNIGIFGETVTADTWDLTDPFKTGFHQLQLAFLSLFYTINQKKNQWTYYYPVSTLNQNVFTNVKNIQFPASQNPLSWDRTIDDNNFNFIRTLIKEDPDQYARHLYAIAYQLLQGGQSDVLNSDVINYDTLPPGISGKLFRDFNYSLNIPVSEESVALLENTSAGNVNVGQETLIADIKPVYNFTIANYEKAISLVPEIRMPNIYEVAKNGIQSVFQGLKIDDPNDAAINSGNYKSIPIFEKIAEQFLNCDEDEASVYSNPEYIKQLNIVFEHSQLSENSQIEDLKDSFPFYNLIEFEVGTNMGVVGNELLNTLYDNQIIQEYVRTHLSSYYGLGAPLLIAGKTGEILTETVFAVALEAAKFADLGIFENTEDITVEAITKNFSNNIVNDTFLRVGNAAIKSPRIYNFNNWLEVYKESPNEVIRQDIYSAYTSFYGDINEGYTSGWPQQNASQVHYTAIKEVYPEMVTLLRRTFDQILNGGKAAKIPLFYTIEKKDLDDNVIQYIIVPAPDRIASSQKSKVRYIDTQVKYGKPYTYSIKAQCLVIGTDYKFRFVNDKETLDVVEQAGYGSVKKEDIIFSTLTTFNGAQLVNLGDPFNLSSNYVFSQGNLETSGQTTLSEQQIQFYGGATGGTNVVQGGLLSTFTAEDYEALGLSAPEEGLDLIPELAAELSEDGTQKVVIKNFYAYTESSLLKTPPFLGPKTEYETTETGEKIWYIFDEAHGTVYINPETGMPSDQLDFGNSVKLQTNSEGQQYFQFNGKTYFVTVSGNKAKLITSVDAEPTATVIEESANKLIAVGINMFQKCKTFETPYFEEKGVTILDNPPISPIVNFYPYGNTRSKLLLTFENQTGMYDATPISILPEDEQIFKNIRLAQKKHKKDQQGNYITPYITFKSDDFASEYQVFRIEGTKPSSYADFSNALYNIVDVRERTAFVETLANNTKYYYIFRTVDLHQNLSNPSALYEVEMVENSGVTYPIISVVEFATPPKDLNSRFFDRYLKIEPALGQKVINEQQSGISSTGAGIENSTPVLGIRDETIWNQKKFKFRIKSVNTGKAIDLNIRFKTNHKQPEPIDSCE